VTKEDLSKSGALPKAVSTLIIGDIGRWRNEGRDVASINDFTFTSLAELTSEVLSRSAAQIVLSPLVSDDFDAVDVARALGDLDYKGLYRALATSKMEKDIIMAEVATVAPNLDFDILDIKGQ